MFKLNILILVLLLASCSSMNTKNNSLTPGVYTVWGKCTEMISESRDETSLCSNKVSIKVSNIEEIIPAVDFLFPRKDGSYWLFKGLNSPKIKGTKDRYTVYSLADSSANLLYRYDGECKIINEPTTIIHCFLRNSRGDKGDIIKEVKFASDGNWMYSKEQK